jgi:hypothetical protein
MPTQVLEPLGANCAGSQFLEPDGNFPNHVPNPEDAEAMASATAAVLAANADLGVVFDTDVDRSGACVCECPCRSESCLLAAASPLSGQIGQLLFYHRAWTDGTIHCTPGLQML